MNFISLKNDINSGRLAASSINEIVQAETLLQRSEELLRTCHSQVGMHLGEDIQELLADFKNQKFSAKEYHHERLPDGQ